MRYIDLFNLQLFDIKLDFDVDGESVDIHNNFDCNNIIFENDLLVYIFQSIDKNAHKELHMVFSNPKILTNRFNINDLTYSRTLDNFQRCRCEINGELIEETRERMRCFLLEFFEDQYVELLASAVKLILIEN